MGSALTQRQIVSRIIGDASLGDVASVFTGLLPGTKSPYRSAATAVLNGEEIVVSGKIYLLEGTEAIGRFERRLRYVGNAPRAIHEIMELADDHQDQGIGRAHYFAALRFYDRTGFRLVTLDAAMDGVWVWPQFGFDLAKQMHKQMLFKLMRERQFPETPTAPERIYAPDIVRPRDPALAEQGKLLMEMLLAKNRYPLPMYLDFADMVHREFLVSRKILD